MCYALVYSFKKYVSNPCYVQNIVLSLEHTLTRICFFQYWALSIIKLFYVSIRQWHPTPVRLPGKAHGWRTLVGCSPWGRYKSDTTEQLHFHFPLSCIREGMATHSSVLAWRIPGMGEPGGLPSMGSHRVGHDWSDLAAAAAHLLLGWEC